MSSQRKPAFAWRYRCPEGHVTTSARQTLTGWYCRTCERAYERLRDHKRGEWLTDHSGTLVWVHPHVADGRPASGRKVAHTTRACRNARSDYEKVLVDRLDDDVRECGHCGGDAR